MNHGVVRVLLGAASGLGLLGAAVVLAGVLGTGGAGSPRLAPAAMPTATGPDTGTVAAEGVRATVLAVADPVTMDVRLETGRVLRVRALGVQPPDACYAEPALQFARGTLGGRSVELAGDGRADRFSRALAWVTLPQGDYAVLAAEAGVVTTYPVDTPPERMGAVDEAQDRAEAAGRGLWGPECDDDVSASDSGAGSGDDDEVGDTGDADGDGAADEDLPSGS